MEKQAEGLLKGVAQVMLQESRVVGLLFIIGFFVNIPGIAIFGLVALVCGYLAAIKLPQENQAAGLYGFNAVLVGLAMAYFFGFTWPALAASVIGGAVSTHIMHGMMLKKLRPFTFPFIATTWALIFILKSVGQPLVKHDVLAMADQVPAWMAAISLGFGQVMFQENIFTGAIFGIAIAIHSPLHAVYGLAGSVLGVFVPMALGLSPEATNLGLFAFNPVLCGIALAEKGFKAGVYALAGILLSIAVMWGFMRLNLVALTFPFVLSTWVVFWFRNLLGKKIC